MKNKLLRNVLEGVLVMSLILSVFLFVKLAFKTKQYREFSATINTFQTDRAMLNVLMTEAATYSQQDPSIVPILELVGVRPAKSNPVAAPKPAAK